ncbi:SWIM zinc finger family protein [Caulobacter sp. LjRoot300]|uniref:SWIM zinc finger family protein n=1 Tax=Caulobacter sp. LjRoot300 TaxID=3342321 RepID=UPI003ECE6202
MSHADRLFDADAWRGRMDERWFESGAAMAEAGAVDLVAIEDDVVTGHVTGSAGDLYVVTLRAPAGEGVCTCPGFDKFGACKHQAAVVAAANLLDATGRGYVRDRLARLRDGLALESRDALIERIVELAKKDPKVLAGLEG